MDDLFGYLGQVVEWGGETASSLASSASDVREAVNAVSQTQKTPSQTASEFYANNKIMIWGGAALVAAVLILRR